MMEKSEGLNRMRIEKVHRKKGKRKKKMRMKKMMGNEMKWLIHDGKNFDRYSFGFSVSKVLEHSDTSSF